MSGSLASRQYYRVFGNSFCDAARRLQTLNSVVRDCSCMHDIYLPAVSFTDLLAVSLVGQLQLVLSVGYRLSFPCLQLHHATCICQQLSSVTNLFTVSLSVFITHAVGLLQLALPVGY